MRFKLYIFLPLIFSILFIFLFQGPVLAESTGTSARATLFSKLKGAGREAGLEIPGSPTAVFANLVGSIINVFLSFLGVIGLIIVIYAGYLWLTAGGNDEKITKGKALLKNGVIGLIIISLAYAITNFVIGQIISSVSPAAAPPQELPAGTAPAAPSAGPTAPTPSGRIQPGPL